MLHLTQRQVCKCWHQQQNRGPILEESQEESLESRLILRRGTTKPKSSLGDIIMTRSHGLTLSSQTQEFLQEVDGVHLSTHAWQSVQKDGSRQVRYALCGHAGLKLTDICAWHPISPVAAERRVVQSCCSSSVRRTYTRVSDHDSLPNDLVGLTRPHMLIWAQGSEP